MKKCLSMTWISGMAVVLIATWATPGMAQSNPPVTSSSSKTDKGTTAQTQPTHELVIPVTTGPPDMSSADSSLEPAKPPEVHLSAWTTEIIKMTHAGISDQVLLTYIDNTPGTFNLGADQIIFLTQQGVSSETITEMLQHDAEVASGLRPVTASTVPLSPSAVKITFVPANPATSKASGQSAANSRPSVTAVKASAPLSSGGLPHSLGSIPDSAANSGWQYPDAEEARAVRAVMPVNVSGNEEKTTYPIREPYPVAITAPIVVIRAPGLTPNTVIIDFER